MVVFSDRLKELLEYRHLSYADLARLTGISKGTISNYMKNKYVPKQDKIYIIATACNVSPSWLMGLDVPMQPEKEKAPTEADAEINEYLDELKNRSEMRMLFSVTKDATKEEIEQAVKIIMALRTKDE